MQSCLQSLLDTVPAGKAEVIIGDDATPGDDARDHFAGAGIQVFRNENNLGFAGNCNECAKRAVGDILVFVNSDTLAFSGWWEPVVKLLQQPTIGIVGPKLLNPQGKISSAGGWYDQRKGPFHRYLGEDRWSKRVSQTERVSWITAAVLAIRKALFLELAGFDRDAYPVGYFEDVDLCEKAKAKGLEVWYCAESEFVHAVGQTTAAQLHGVQDSWLAARRFMRNSWEFHRRWDAKIVPDVQRVMVNY